MYSQEYQETLIKNGTVELALTNSQFTKECIYPINCSIPKNTTLTKLDFYNITTPLLNVNINHHDYKFNNNLPTIDNLNIKNLALINLLFDDTRPPVIKHMAATTYYPPCGCCVQDEDIELNDEADIFEENDKHKLEYYYKSYTYTFQLPTIVAHYVYTGMAATVDAK